MVGVVAAAGVVAQSIGRLVVLFVDVADELRQRFVALDQPVYASTDYKSPTDRSVSVSVCAAEQLEAWPSTNTRERLVT